MQSCNYTTIFSQEIKTFLISKKKPIRINRNQEELLW